MNVNGVVADLQRELKRRNWRAMAPRHTHSAPHEHDFSDDGRKALGLTDFLNEVEGLLTELDLP